MRDSAPHRLTERRQAILRQTSAALRGQPVILWRVVKGIALAEVASPANPPRDVIEFDVVAAPPDGVERRSPERLVLELAGLSLGALEQIWAVADQATVYLCGALALLEACLERVRAAHGLTTTARAHLLADLAFVADAIQGGLDAA